MNLEADKFAVQYPLKLPKADFNGRIALFGGSFNPPHIAHILAVQTILCLTDVEKIWLMPTYSHAFDKELADFDIRVQMCKQSFETLGNFVEIIELERELPKPSYTIQTLEYIAHVYPQIRPYIIIGSDILDELHLWHRIDDIRKMADFLVIPRQGYSEQGDFDVILPEISSTEIRRCVKTNSTISRVLAPAVLQNIKDNKLYL